MKNLDDIEKMILECDFKDAASVWRIESRIKDELTLSEIVLFSGFLHGGTFTSPRGWEYSQAGVTMPSREEDNALESLWDNLLFQVHAIAGAAAIIRQHDAKLRDAYAFASDGDLYELTINQCVKFLPSDFMDKVKREFEDARKRQSGLTKENARLKAEIASLNAKR